jgi:hypothetical protein
VDSGGVERRACQLAAGALLRTDYAARVVDARCADHASEDDERARRPDAEATRLCRGSRRAPFRPANS